VQKMSLLSILMPVFNERATVERAIAAAVDAQLPVPHELIIVDDGSTDGTSRILSEGEWGDQVSVHHHAVNQGKGAAVRTALKHARGDLSAILDADLEYRADDLAELLVPMLDRETNVVYGVRWFHGHTSHSFLYVLGNRGVTLVANLLFNVYLSDIMTCHKVLRTDLFRDLHLQARGFEIEAEITARVLQHGERIYEIPVNYRARSSDEGKKLTGADGFRVVRTLVRCRLSNS
jgi:glycosyltransferase involved in cell wall biosynthesis